MSPLLLDLSDELKIPLQFFSSHIPSAPAAGLAADMNVSKSWSVRNLPGLRRYDLRGWLDSPTYFVVSTKNYRTRNQALKHISNKEVGAHYDRMLVPVVDNMRRCEIRTHGRTYNGIAFFLLDIAALVYWQGERLRRIWSCTQQGQDPSSDAQLKQLDDHFDKLKYGISGIQTIQLFGYEELISRDHGKANAGKEGIRKAKRRSEIAKQSRKKNRHK